jgi:hypothetical protein
MSTLAYNWVISIVVQLGLALYNNAAHPVISEGWNFTTMLAIQL